MQNCALRIIVTFSVLASIIGLSPNSKAVTVLSGPTFTPAVNAPLAGVLQLTTDVDSRVSVKVSDGTNVWERDFYDFGTVHSETLLGFKPGRTNLISVTVYDQYRNACTAPGSLSFVTAPLPTNPMFPTIVVLTNQPSLMEPGYTLCIVENIAAGRYYITIMDNSGEVVWYRLAGNPGNIDIKQLSNGDLFIPQQSPANSLIEINMLGDTVKKWNPLGGFPVDGHDGFPTAHGTILYFTNTNRVVPNFPMSATVSNAPLTSATVDDTLIVEISATNSALINMWSLMDMLDPTRVTYNTYVSPGPVGVDNEHANAFIEDTNDNSIIVSVRNQNAIVKFSRTGQLKWILGPPENWKTNSQGTNLQQYLLTPTGTPFTWNYAEHSLMLTPQRTLLTYDNGNFRANPFDTRILDQDNFSRGVEYKIDETNMTVSQVWDTTQAAGDRLYTPVFGKTQWLPKTGNRLVTYGEVTYINGVHPSTNAPNAVMARIIEYTHDPVPQVVSDFSFFDYTNTSDSYRGYCVYRALRIPDLYAHPANAVTDMVVIARGETAHLEFSADPTFTYAIQASTDLINWTDIGTAVQVDGTGNFDFDDLSASQFTARFYRVVTE